MATEIEAARLLTYNAARLKEEGKVRFLSFPFHSALCVSHPTVRSSDHLFLLLTRSRSSRKPRWQSGAFPCPLYLAPPFEVSLTSTLFDLGFGMQVRFGSCPEGVRSGDRMGGRGRFHARGKFPSLFLSPSNETKGKKPVLMPSHLADCRRASRSTGATPKSGLSTRGARTSSWTRSRGSSRSSTARRAETTFCLNLSRPTPPYPLSCLLTTHPLLAFLRISSLS